MGELRTASLTGSKPGIWVGCFGESSPSSATAASESGETAPLPPPQDPTISFFGLSAPFILEAAAAPLFRGVPTDLLEVSTSWQTLAGLTTCP